MSFPLFDAPWMKVIGAKEQQFFKRLPAWAAKPPVRFKIESAAVPASARDLAQFNADPAPRAGARPPCLLKWA
jgi:hypothetical protein